MRARELGAVREGESEGRRIGKRERERDRIGGRKSELE